MVKQLSYNGVSKKAVSSMFSTFRIIRNKKGQGHIEYAILLAFIVGLAVIIHSINLSGAVTDAFDDSSVNFASLRGGEKQGTSNKQYAEYFHDWRGTTSSQLHEIDNQERLKADQQALALIAQAFFDKNEEEVGELIASLSAPKNGNDKFYNSDNYRDSDDKNRGKREGWSDTLVPLSYQTNSLDNADGNGLIHLDQNSNVNTVRLLSNDVAAYERGHDVKDATKTTVRDRIFYSDGMITTGNNNANQRMVTLQVHYNSETKTVDSVNIQARTGNSNGVKRNTNNIVNGLNLNVTKSGYTTIN